jgi:L-asparaginase II
LEPKGPKSKSMSKVAPPCIVKIIRGNICESEHLVDIVVCDEHGKVVLTYGDPKKVIFPRSSIKMIQAIPIVESGAYDHYQLDSRHLAMACSSHNGEQLHVELVANWLEHIGLGESALLCGPHRPFHYPSLETMIKNGHSPCQLHNNCSGKHTGIITTARFSGSSLGDYTEYHHPTQTALRSLQEDMMERDLSSAPWDRDGCSIPAYAYPLESLAYSLSKFLNTSSLSKERARAIKLITDSCLAHPHLIAGEGRFCSFATGYQNRKLMVKTGAEGVYTAISFDQGMTIALKARDGHKRASTATLAKLLVKLEIIPESCPDWVSWSQPEIKNWRQFLTGHIKVEL